MNRRFFIIGIGALFAAQLNANVQQAHKVRRVALIASTTPVAEMAGPEPLNPFTRAFLHELRVLGYIEGRNLIIERRSAEGRPERYSEIAAELGLTLPPPVPPGFAAGPMAAVMRFLYRYFETAGAAFPIGGGGFQREAVAQVPLRNQVGTGIFHFLVIAGT